MSTNRVIHFYADINMNSGHIRLAEIAGKKIAALKAGEFVAFVNTKFTAMKLYGCHGVIVHWRQEPGQTLYNGIVSVLPKFLSGADIGFTREIANAIADHYEAKVNGGRRRAKGRAA